MFVLSGEDLTLPFGEIGALLETYSEIRKSELMEKRTVVSDLADAEIANKIADRAAYCRFGGLLFSKERDLLSIANGIDLDLKNSGRTFVVASSTVPREKRGELGDAIIKRTGGRVSLSNPDFVFQVEFVKGLFFAALSDQGFKKQSWRERRPRARRFFLPSAIFPKLARAIVNLSRVREGDLFCDPFCGTGSLGMESGIMGIRSVGIDLVRWISRGALLNMRAVPSDFGILRADSTSSLPLREVDAIATDVPYGRASSTKGKSTREIIREFLLSAHDVLRSTKERPGYCVLMHPSSIEPEIAGNSFQLVERHLIYVHRSLTRAISVLRKE